MKAYAKSKRNRKNIYIIFCNIFRDNYKNNYEKAYIHLLLKIEKLYINFHNAYI